MASDEFFYLDANGVKQDQELHEPILASPEGTLRSDWAAVDAWVALGKTEEEAIAIVFAP
jgi:hypothetical protein